MSLFTIALRTKIFDLCVNAFFERVTANLTVVKSLGLKEGDRFSAMRSDLHEVVDFTNVLILEVASTFVSFQAYSKKYGRQVGAVIRAKNHLELMNELESWEFIP